MTSDVHLRDNHCWSARAELKIRCWPIRFELESPANRLRSRRLPPLPCAVVPAWELDCSCHVSRSFPEKFHQAAAAPRVWPGGRLPLPHRERRLRLPSQTEPRRGRIAERAHHRAQSRSASDADYLTGRFGSLEPRRGFSPHRTAPGRSRRAFGRLAEFAQSPRPDTGRFTGCARRGLGARRHTLGPPSCQTGPFPFPFLFPCPRPLPPRKRHHRNSGRTLFLSSGRRADKMVVREVARGPSLRFPQVRGAIRQLW